MPYSDDLFQSDSAPTPSPRRPQGADPNGYKIVSIRLREAEFEVFAEQARAFGLTNNMALRIAARRIGGFLEIDSETRRMLLEISSAIDLMSERIVDLRSDCARTGHVDMKEFATQHAAFGRVFAQLDAKLRTILNGSHRRLDGRLMLRNATES
ncbi:DNA mobilization endonuclease VirD1/MobC family subunit [Mesorhizobium sp. GbtcB19]|uniref:DNA mobilization endonuclease VirD1/MobC family subunit n=1 Tax=Mesorhizobium sp. GbtcB19 TaxID=2824764 RepID=UPI001C2F74AD|nr:DNA mobilization endonuclease VirD1/MobC family subunit [Mesorhizobium sp. GbtcB19]